MRHARRRPRTGRVVRGRVRVAHRLLPRRRPQAGHGRGRARSGSSSTRHSRPGQAADGRSRPSSPTSLTSVRRTAPGARRSTSPCSPIRAAARSATTGSSGRRTGSTWPSASARPASRSGSGKGRACVSRPCRSDYREALALAEEVAAGRRTRDAAAGRRSAVGCTTSCRLATCGPACRCWSRWTGRSRSVASTAVEIVEHDGPGLRPRGRRRRHTYVADGVAGAQLGLPISGGGHLEHPGVRGGVPRRHRDRARAELPVDPDDPRRRQRGHRQQPGPQAQGAVDRPGRRRRHRALPRRRRVRRGPVGRPRDVEAARRRRPALGRRRRLLPHQRPEPGRSRTR